LIVARISDEALITVNSLELIGIIYLAVAVSFLREKIARMEGKLEGKREEEQQERDRRHG
jgi:2-methylisocitrate lyase-like PEP mutase family enzyme